MKSIRFLIGIFVLLNVYDAHCQCSFTVDAGPDLKVCKPGDMVMINGKVTGSVQEIFWEPPTGLSNPRSPVTKATVSGPIEYILTAKGVSNINLITNGNFEAGNTGFTTDYVVGTMSCYGAGYLDCEGTYDVISNPQSGHTGFAPCGDHTSGSGLMMVLNGSANLQNVWCQTINVMPDMDYIFSAWVTSVVSSSPPILQFSINGTNIGNIFNSSGVNCSWEQFQTTWNSGSNTTAEICIVNLNTATGGNDFAIDDLTFRKVCEIKDTMKIEVEEIIISIENPELMTCDHPRWKLDATASSSGSGWKYQWTTSDGKIISGGTTLTPTIEGPGTYYLTICSPLPNCCKTEFVTVLGNIKPPDLQLIVKDTIGCNVQAASINSRSKVFPLEYEWEGPNGFVSTDPSVVVTSGGKYTLTITDEYNCKTIDSVEVFERIDNPKISIRSNSINCQTDTAALIGNSSVPGSTFEWTGPNQFFIKADSFQTSDSGWYYLKVTTPSGCIKTDSVWIRKDLNKPQFQFTTDTISCKNDTAQVLVNTNINPVSSGWRSTQNFQIKDTFSIRTHHPGVYTFYATGPNGCSDSVNIVVPVDTMHPVINPANDTLNCIKTNIRLISGNTDPGTSISWKNPGGLEIPNDSIDINIPGQYRVTAQSENGCQQIADIIIGIDTLHPLLSTQNDTLNCFKQKIKLQLSDASRSGYLWTGPGNFSDTLKQPEIQIPGTYQVTASLTNGCKSVAQIRISIDTTRPLIAFSSDTLNCKKDSVILSATADRVDAQFIWSGPNGYHSNLRNPYTSQSGNYVLQVTNPNGCSDSIRLTIYQDIRKPEIYLEPDTLNCLKRNTILHGRTNRDSLMYSWTGPNGLVSTDSILSINMGGPYKLQVESPEGCKSEVTITVFEDTLKTMLYINPDTLNCMNTEWLADLGSSLSPTSFSWSGPLGFNSQEANPKITTGGSYSVVVTTANLCTSTLAFSVVQDTLRPAILYSGDSISCFHPEAILRANITPPNLTGFWIDPLGQRLAGNTLQTQTGGMYHFEVTGYNFCTNRITTIVLVDTMAPDLHVFGDTITCLQPSASLLAKSQTPGIGLNWNGPSGFTSKLDSISVLIPGVYTATVTGPNGCKSFQNILIPIDTTHPIVAIRSDSINCRQNEATLSAQVNPPSARFQWTDQNNTPLSSQLVYKTKKGGVFHFIATNPGNGCQTLKTQTVFEDSLLIRDVLLTQDHPVCGGIFGSMHVAEVIGGHAGLLFSLNDANSFSSQTLFGSLPAGSYTLFVKDSADCRFEKTFEIIDIPAVDANLASEISLKLGKGGLLDLNIISDPKLVKNIDWSPKSYLSCTDCEDPVATPPGNQEYEVTIVDTNGCVISKRILVKIETPNVWAPNVFSPNGDQINDRFFIISSDPDITSINFLEIFDRWGNKVFETVAQKPNDAGSGWDGAVKNEKCLPGVYVYWAEIELINGTKWILKGDLTLLK